MTGHAERVRDRADDQIDASVAVSLAFVAEPQAAVHDLAVRLVIAVAGAILRRLVGPHPNPQRERRAGGIARDRRQPYVTELVVRRPEPVVRERQRDRRRIRRDDGNRLRAARQVPRGVGCRPRDSRGPEREHFGRVVRQRRHPALVGGGRRRQRHAGAGKRIARRDLDVRRAREHRRDAVADHNHQLIGRRRPGAIVNGQRDRMGAARQRNGRALAVYGAERTRPRVDQRVAVRVRRPRAVQRDARLARVVGVDRGVLPRVRDRRAIDSLHAHVAERDVSLSVRIEADPPSGERAGDVEDEFAVDADADPREAVRDLDKILAAVLPALATSEPAGERFDRYARRVLAECRPLVDDLPGDAAERQSLEGRRRAALFRAALPVEQHEVVSIGLMSVARDGRAVAEREANEAAAAGGARRR